MGTTKMSEKASHGPALPPETASKGSENAANDGRSKAQPEVKAGKGPKMRDNGAYAPAVYPVGNFIRRDN